MPRYLRLAPDYCDKRDLARAIRVLAASRTHVDARGRTNAGSPTHSNPLTPKWQYREKGQLFRAGPQVQSQI